MLNLSQQVLSISQRMDLNRKAQDEELQGVRAQLKGVNSHLRDIDSHIGDIDIWRKGVDSQLGHLASQIPRPQGQLPGRPEENPRSQIASMHLRSGKELTDPAEVPRNEKEQSPIPISSRYGHDISQQRPVDVHIEQEPDDIEQGQSHNVPRSVPSKVRSSPILPPPLPFPKKIKDNTDAK